MKISTEVLESLTISPELLILTAGFEDRCLAILKYIRGIDLSNSNVILLHYIEQEDIEVNLANKKNEDKIIAFFNQKGIKYEKITLDHIRPINTLVKIKEFIDDKRINSDNEVLIDISSTKDSIITLIAVLLLKNNFKSVRFIYTIPKEYNLVEISKRYKNIEEFIQEIVDKNFQRISSLIRISPFEGFEGLPDPTLPSRLIFLAGFDVNKVLVVCRRFEDSWVTMKKILIGNSSFIDNEEQREFSWEIHERMTRKYDLDYTLIECHNVNKILSSLQELVNPFIKSENIILCCFGTKIQILACTLFSYKNPQITLLKVQMRQYIPRYFSTGIEKSLVVKIAS